MSMPFLGEIRVFAYGFAPAGWAQCNGGILRINEHAALFSLLSNIYGGDGITTFAVPNLQDRAVLHSDQYGAAPHAYRVAQTGGEVQVKLTFDMLATHTHAMQGDASIADAKVTSPAGALPGDVTADKFYSSATPDTAMTVGMTQPTGGDGPHNNLQPYLYVNYCIALEGEFPVRPEEHA